VLLSVATLDDHTLCFSTFAHNSVRIKFQGIRWKYLKASTSCLYSPRPRLHFRPRTIRLPKGCSVLTAIFKANCLYHCRASVCIMTTPKTERKYRFELVTPANPGTWNALSYSLLYFIVWRRVGDYSKYFLGVCISSLLSLSHSNTRKHTQTPSQEKTRDQQLIIREDENCWLSPRLQPQYEHSCQLSA
jgi:hypothetical protein